MRRRTWTDVHARCAACSIEWVNLGVTSCTNCGGPLYRWTVTLTVPPENLTHRPHTEIIRHAHD